MDEVGIGIITCNREDFFKKCLESVLKYSNGATIVVVNDGKPLSFKEENVDYIENNTSKQVGECKNIAMKHLLDKGCNYIFTLEDDVFIKDPETFLNYINASKKTGIQHFNFGFSQKENLDSNLKPLYKKVVDYKDIKVILTPNVLGAFTFYTRECLQTIGLHHKDFNKGHGDHPELTYRAYKHGFTTPFWWFADIYGSWDMIGNLSNMGSDSLVRNQQEFWNNFNAACEKFRDLHGYRMLDVPMKTEAEVIDVLKKLKGITK